MFRVLQLFIFFIILDFSTTTLLVVETHYPEIPVGKAFGLSEHANLFFSSAATKPKAHVALHLSWEKQDFLARSWLLQAPEYDFLETGQLVFLEPSETLWPPLCDIALGKMLQSNKICSYMWFLKGALVAYRPRWVEQGQQKPLMALSSKYRMSQC